MTKFCLEEKSLIFSFKKPFVASTMKLKRVITRNGLELRGNMCPVQSETSVSLREVGHQADLQKRDSAKAPVYINITTGDLKSSN